MQKTTDLSAKFSCPGYHGEFSYLFCLRSQQDPGRVGCRDCSTGEENREMFPNTEMPAYVSQAQERAKRGQQASKEQGDSQARAARRKWNRKGAKAEAGQAAKVENTEQAPSSSGKKKRKYTMSPEALEARRKAGVNARAVKARKMEESHLLTACDDSRLRSLSHQSAAIIGCAEVATIIEHLRSHALQSASSRVFVVAQVEYIRDLINEGRVEEAIKRLKMTAEAISQGEEGIC